MGFKGFKSRRPTEIIGVMVMALMAPCLAAMIMASIAEQMLLAVMWYIIAFVVMVAGANIRAIGAPSYRYDAELKKFVPVISDEQE